MIIVTGGAGMIGSNLIIKLNQLGLNDIHIVDNLHNGKKFSNISDLAISDYHDKNEFYIKLNNFKNVQVVFHLGACSDTTNWDGRYLLKNNYECSKILYNWCQENKTPMIYASSASVYGKGDLGFQEKLSCEKPINLYAYSKFLFDQYVRINENKRTAQVVGLRYFNVYGPREQHKGNMASTIFHFNKQILSNEEAKVFKGNGKIKNGEHKRDFVYVEDCADLNFWFFKNPQISGIFNVGTGKAETFNEVANSIISWHKRGKINYIEFPENLLDAYQNYTQADLNSLKATNCPIKFRNIQNGIKDYLEWLN